MTLTLLQWAIAFPLGIFLSTIGTLVGLGGGVFMVPILVLIFDVPLTTAIAVVTFCLLPSALLSTIFNARAKHIDYFAGIALEIPTVAGAMLGAYLSTLLPVQPMETLFAMLVAFMGWRILKGKPNLTTEGPFDHINKIPPVIERSNGEVTYRAGIPAIGFFGLISGVLAGMFGIGGGIIKTPVMLKIFRMPARRATGTALFMIVFTSATAAFSHWKLGRMDWNLALPLGGAFFCGSLLGNNIAGKIKATTVETLLGVVLALASVAVLIHAWML